MRISDPLIGSQLGDYQIIDLLGRGGMARVYRGYDARLERYAAVKVIDTNLRPEDVEEYEERFQREARSIARLNHPCIVGVYQFGQVDSLYYMAMAFVEGRDLAQVLREYAQQRRRMAYGDIMRIIGDIAAALDHAHAGGVIHRDIKPSNIMVKADGHAVLTDFGLALSVPEGSIGTTFGSAHYIAPEQAVSSADAVPQSDLYSLGIVLYQMLTGKVPFDDPSAMSIALKHMNQPPPPPSKLNTELPPAVEAVVLRALEKDPADRYPTGKALTAALADALKSVRTQNKAAATAAPDATGEQTTSLSARQVKASTSTRPPSAPVTHRRSRRLWLIAVVGSALAFIAALLFVVLPRTLMGPPAPTLTEDLDGLALIPSDEASVASTTEAAAVVDLPTATATPSPTATDPPTATERPTSTPTPTPSDTAAPTVRPTASATERATATSAPTETPSQVPTPTLSPTAVIIALEPTNAVDAPVGLVYDDATLVLINRSDHAVDLSGIEFAQRLPDGTELTFQADLWGAQTLLPSNCYQVWTNRYTLLPQPLHCRERQGWRAVSFIRTFWTSEREDATFDVRRGRRVLATCHVDASTCSFDPGERLFP